MSQEEKRSFQFPVSTLVGSGFSNFRKILSGHVIDSKYRRRYLMTYAGSAILSLLTAIENRKVRKRVRNTPIEVPPIFIIGFWRSGTTLLHTMLCTDRHAAYVDTFQGIFPNHIFMHKAWISFLAKLIMPSRRPVDGVKLDLDFPQEEEIALGNMQPVSFYNFFYFPRDIEDIKRQSLYFDGMDEKDIQVWEEHYKHLIRSAILNTNGRQFISKSPPNTFRIPCILEMFPNAKFIYLSRDPLYVLSSFKKFATKVAQGIGFHVIDEEDLERPLCELYRELTARYDRDQHLIPKENLLEIRYEELIRDPVATVMKIYETFHLGEPNLPAIRKLIRDKPPGSTSNYSIPPSIREFVKREL